MTLQWCRRAKIKPMSASPRARPRSSEPNIGHERRAIVAVMLMTAVDCASHDQPLSAMPRIDTGMLIACDAADGDALLFKVRRIK